MPLPPVGPPVADGSRTIRVIDPESGAVLPNYITLNGEESNAAGPILVEIYDKNGTIVTQKNGIRSWKCDLPGLHPDLGPYTIHIHRDGNEHHMMTLNTSSPPSPPPVMPPVSPPPPVVPPVSPPPPIPTIPPPPPSPPTLPTAPTTTVSLPAPITPTPIAAPITQTGPLWLTLGIDAIQSLCGTQLQALSQILAAMQANPSGFICVTWNNSETGNLPVPDFGERIGGAGVEPDGGRFPGAPGYGGGN